MIARGSSIVWLRAVMTSTALAALGGCTTLGGNVKGSFSCTAPDGICAPSSSIDDRALAMIAGDTGAGEATPISPTRDTRPKATAPRAAAAGQRVPLERADVQRTQERVLRIVFQPYIDEFGRLHEASAVHAVVAGGAWQQQLLAASTAVPDLNAVPRPAAPQSLAEAVDRADAGGAELSAIDPNLPDAAVVAAARARAAAVDPVAAIRTDVAARLAPKAGRTPRPVVSTAAGQGVKRKTLDAPARALVKAKTAADLADGAKPMSNNKGGVLVAKAKAADEAAKLADAGKSDRSPALAPENAGGNVGAQAAPPATKPPAKAPVRPADFPGAVWEEN